MQNRNSIKSLLAPVFKRWYLIVICLLIAAGGAWHYLQVATPKYKASATIRIEDKSGISDTKLFKDFDVFNQNNNIQTEVEVLKSRYLFENALQKLDFFTEYYRTNDMQVEELYHTCPFKVDYSITDNSFDKQSFDFKYLSSGRYKIYYSSNKKDIEKEAKLGDSISDNGWCITVSRDTAINLQTGGHGLSDSYRFIIYSKNALAQKLMNKDYQVRAVDKDVDIIKIYYQHAIPEKAMKLVNAVTEAYLEQGLDNKKDLANSTLDFINRQLEIVTAELNGAQNALKKYKVDNEIINIAQQTDATFKILSQLELQKVDINMKLAMLENLSEYLRRNKEIDISGPEYSAIADPLFTEGVSKLNIKLRERITAMARYTANDPHLYNIENEIVQLRDYLIESVDNTRKQLLVRQNELYTSIDEQKATFEGVPEKESTLNGLTRNFFLFEKVYNFLIEKRTEALITSQVTVSFNKILEIATLPHHQESPVPNVVWCIALFLGLIMGILSAYIAHFIKSSVSSREDMEKVSSIPFIGNIERFNKKSSGYNSFAALTTRILLNQEDKKCMVVSVTSTSKGEGKSMIATGVARTLAAMDKKVIMIDANLYNPTLFEWFDVRNPAGIADVYENKASLHDVINISSFPNLDIINTGDNSKPISHLLATSKTKEIINELSEHYDAIIIDTPESGKYVDAIPFMKWSDLNLYVVKADDTKAELINNAELIKEEYRLKEVYFVLNSMQEQRNHTGYINAKKFKAKRKKLVPQLTSLFAW